MFHPCETDQHCCRHSAKDIDETLYAYREAMEILADAIRSGTVEAKLEGPVVQPVFRRA